MKITVKRYDPSKDNAPYETTYEVPHDDEYMTLLQALVYIHENEEPLAFDFSCRGRMCGRCAMMLDGEPVLACVEPLPDGAACGLAGGERPGSGQESGAGEDRRDL